MPVSLKSPTGTQNDNVDGLIYIDKKLTSGGEGGKGWMSVRMQLEAAPQLIGWVHE